ncbi:MAG: 50S ribosomal protein L11 methyltransferase [Desulfobacterales bacterium]|nr:MAG: 50S ribosomal protein L11 methyltransferase [Desulfobacterales bacterium]
MTISESTGKDKLTQIETLRQVLLDMVSESEIRLTQGALEKRLRQQLSVSKSTFKAVVNDLVADGELVYTYTFGSSFLEKSFNRSVRISKQIILKPPDVFYQPVSGEIVVKLVHGASFGTGDHPTTRLAARGIEWLFSTGNVFHHNNDLQALDIGTGSGVLAIIAVLLGAKTAVGIDIDPCARSEAKKNIALNHLENQIDILDQSLEQLDKVFSIVIANLRVPTLKKLSSLIAEKMEKGGVVVVSGVRGDEVPDLVKAYGKIHFRCVWENIEKDWAGLVFGQA